MKKEIPGPVIVVSIVIACLLLGILAWRTLAPGRPAVVPGGVHVSPPSHPMNPVGGPVTGGSTGQ